MKLLGLTAAGVSSSCLENPETYHWLATRSQKFTSYLNPPEDGTVPGQAMYYPSTCTECPAHCAMIVKVRNGNPIKLEGHPQHPISNGKLCVRGQAALTRLYHPQRLGQPMMRGSDGKLAPTTWDQALSKVTQVLQGGGRHIYLSGRTSGSLSQLLAAFCQKAGIIRHAEFELFDHAALRAANQKVFGRSEIPVYQIAKSDVLITVGADILETFVSPVFYSGQFAKARDQKTWTWFHVEPHVSLTGLKANKRVVIAPQSEVYLLRFLLAQAQSTAKNKLPQEIMDAIGLVTLDEAVAKTGIGKATLAKMAERLTSAKQPLVIAGGVALAQASGLETAVLTALLQWSLGMAGETVDFSQAEDYSLVGNLNDMKALAQSLSQGDVGVVFVSRTDPVAQLPVSLSFGGQFKKAKLRVGMGDFLDATLQECDVVLPLSHATESLADARPRRNITSIIQPVIKPLHDTRQEGDILLTILQRLKVANDLPATFEEYLYDLWAKAKFAGSLKDHFLKNGFYQETFGADVTLHTETAAGFLKTEAKLSPALSGKAVLIFSPSLRSYDGRSKVLPLLEEIPDPLSTITYGEWISVSDKSAQMGLADAAEVELSCGQLKTTRPAKLQPLLTENVVMMQYPCATACQLGFDSRCGQAFWVMEDVAIAKTGKEIAIPILSGGMDQTGRGILGATVAGHAHGHTTDSHGHEHKIPKSFYEHEHEHQEYQWAMAIDLAKCSGCSACVAACYIENNVPVVGKRDHLKGRELSWLHIEPYIKDAGDGIQFVPMLCQQCCNAPCEPVCPAFATMHSAEGLNVQVYSRCVGTRYCANNCPFKVRRFNWFDYERPEPTTKMHNPDVIVRSKGVMEKCTFCVQRLRVAKDKAKDEKRLVVDGEVTPACAQTCPSQAIVFGNLLDKNSQVYRLAHSDRAYRIYESLGVEPSVYYLKEGKRDEL